MLIREIIKLSSKKIIILGGTEVTTPPYTEATMVIAEAAARRFVENPDEKIIVSLETIEGDKAEVSLSGDDIEKTSVNVVAEIVPLEPASAKANL
jgi:hypothetical protein